jgi:DNA polymerase-3 subunit chi
VTRIDFYLDADKRTDTARRLAHKAHAAGMRVLIYTPEESVAAALDRMLWTSGDIAFLPHCREGIAIAERTPVVIGVDGRSFAHDDLIINLHDEPPPCFASFHRLIEIVSQDEEDKARARIRFGFYRDRGYALQTHPLGGRPQQ